MKMTFQRFIESGKRYSRYAVEVTDLVFDAELRAEYIWAFGPKGQYGYFEEYSYQEVPRVGVEATPAIQMYYLVIENQDWFNTDKRTIMETLYKWAESQDMFHETPSDMRQRLLEISNEAMTMFWEHVADGYSELTTDDLTPQATQDFEQAVFKVVTTWRDSNGGGQDVN